ncbi:MAG TPA: heme-degrading domain-containing protein [Bryobacteraceae bacterium]|jgi:uncharacterized protein (UPF0303 family)
MPIADDLALIARQEATLQLTRFDEETAWRIGSRLREIAAARQLGIVIEVRRFGQPLFYCALAGSSPDNAEWARRKANTVARFHRSSYAVGLELEQKNTTLLEKFGLTLAEYAAHGGSFPLSVSGAGVIGSVTVSGLPQREDHQLVVEALCFETGQDFDKLSTPSVTPMRSP